MCFNSFTKDDLLDEFFRKYPLYKKKKGRELNHQDYINIIKFFDEKKVKMLVFSRTIADWSYYNKLYKTQHEYKEKICGLIYFYLLNHMAWPDCRYDIISCVESQIGDIHRVFHHCDRLHNITKNNPYYNFEFNYLHSTDKHSRGVKIADFIASSAKFFKIKDLSKFNITRYYILKKRPNNWYFRVIFK